MCVCEREGKRERGDGDGKGGGRGCVWALLVKLRARDDLVGLGSVCR
jgi:hypothetical protein